MGADGCAHETHFVHASGYLTNSRTSTVFGMIYQARYLSGLVAGDALAYDLRTEIALLREELDLLKRAFRRHCLETM